MKSPTLYGKGIDYDPLNYVHISHCVVALLAWYTFTINMEHEKKGPIIIAPAFSYIVLCM